jgi:tetratricopeptide (TPR) repeat protein
MGRSRRHLRYLGRRGGNGNGHGPDAALLAAVLSPTYVPTRDGRPPVVAPVLELEGLDPGTEIRGPDLPFEIVTDEDPCLVCDDPAQLELEPVDAPPERPSDVTGPAAAAVPEAAVVRAADVAEPADKSVAEALPPVAEIEAPPSPPPAPDPIEVWYGEARAAADAGEADRAEALYRSLLAERPAHVRARNNLALLLDAAGNHQGALAELDRALELEPENGTLLVNRGALLGAMGRYAAAERDLKKVLRVEPSHGEALFNLGVVMTKKGLWGEAVPHLTRAVELEPARGAAHYYLGEALNHVDDLPGALASYQRAAELQPNNPRALYGLGIIYDRLARPDDAALMYRRSREVARR